jgi:glutamate-ammonia-ligase adenylyltransferase
VTESASRSKSWRDWLEAAPDPEAATKLAESVLAALPEPERERAVREHPDDLGSLLLTLCGIAPFFAPILRRAPAQLLELLAEDPDRPRERADLERRLAAAIAEASGGSDVGSEEAALRLFKYYELARITWRDCRPDGPPLSRSGETLADLSQLADVLLASSLEVARRRVEARYGPPEWHVAERPDDPPERLEFCVIGLGKLGGEELNFSSDVDLIYVYEAPSGDLEIDSERPPPTEYFTRVAQAFGGIVGSRSAEGFLYRVDLDLRPSGAQGALVIHDDALASYYELWADTWEKATFTKARPVAGDLAFGWRTVRSIGPMIYLSTMDYASVQSIRELKDKFEEAHGSQGSGFNVKLDRGGIREVEFVAQAMQLLHGARIPQLRTRSTRDGLDQLARVGLLERDRADVLSLDYLYLRRLENRLQMEGERQVHSLPRDAGAGQRLARAMGHLGADAGEALAAEIESCRERIHSAYESVLAGSGLDGGVEGVIDVFSRGAPQLMTFPATRRMVEELAASFAREIDASGERERALNNLDRFVKGIGGRRFYYELLLDRPELVPRLAALFAASKFLSSYVARHPRLIEPLFEDPELLLPERSALREELNGLTRLPEGSEADPVDRHLDGLRLFHHRQTVNVGLLDLADLIEPAQAQTALTEIAELCLENALDFAREQLASRLVDPDDPAVRRYAVVAMGKLASRELAYGSDLDVIFLFDAKQPDGKVDLDAQDYFVRLTQRLISTLQTPTTEGTCYEIDARLRPSGNQGTLVTSLDAFTRYHDQSAQLWERQALLRARAVAGDADLASAFEALRLDILRRPLPDDAVAEIHRIRQRMETELARETNAVRNFKTGRGGVLDVETVVQALQLRHGAEHPELLEVQATEVQLERLAGAGLLSPESAEALHEGWRFLIRLSSHLRIIDNRSISDLDQERGDLEGLARRLGYTSPGREGGARRALMTDYERHTNAIRAEYEALFQNE